MVQVESQRSEILQLEKKQKKFDNVILIMKHIPLLFLV